MLNPTRLKIYVNAYIVRLEKGESIENIDESYLSLNRIKEDDVKQIHKNVESIIGKI